MSEQWKQITGYEGLYEISNHGRVRLSNGKLRKINNCNEYPLILLTKNGKKYQHKIHRLVAEHFVENPENKPQVNHIDGNKFNPMHTNLEWVTASENILHSFRIGTRGLTGVALGLTEEQEQKRRLAILKYYAIKKEQVASLL